MPAAARTDVGHAIGKPPALFAVAALHGSISNRERPARLRLQPSMLR